MRWWRRRWWRRVHNRVVPLQPEFVVPQDGHDKQDCESMAARRWLAAHGLRYAKLDPVYLGDDRDVPLVSLSKDSGLPVFLPVSLCYLFLEKSI